jgi:hypothetical protein
MAGRFPGYGARIGALEYRALSSANVVIYDRTLALSVARFLPLGGYAEPVASGDGQLRAGSERCLRFVRDGWSVARLLYPGFRSGLERLEMVRQLSYRLLAEVSADLPVQIFVSVGRGRYEGSETQLNRLDEAIAAYASVRSSTFTIVLDVNDAGGAPRFSVASANGLAG